jgi:hypothetical protein
MLISPVSSDTAAYFVWLRGTYIAYAKTSATEKSCSKVVAFLVSQKWSIFWFLEKCQKK